MSDFIIKGREKDLGGFSIHRSLPTAKKRQLGPFVFLDHMGPFHVDDQHAMDVRPHPHIGLATVTYLFEGNGLHRDSLGSEQIISEGDLNLMTAGRGIVHSERTPREYRTKDANMTMHGVQIWVGLPTQFEEVEPSFNHYPKATLPLVDLNQSEDGKEVLAKLMIGEFGGKKSPVKTYSRMLFMDVNPKSNLKTKISFDEKEIGIFLAAGELAVNGQKIEVEDMIVVSDPQNIEIELYENSRLVIIGGEPFPEERFMWWNFVSSKKERIRKAAQDWKDQKMGKVPGETEFIPLPSDPLP